MSVSVAHFIFDCEENLTGNITILTEIHGNYKTYSNNIWT